MSQAPYGYKWGYNDQHQKVLVEDKYEQKVIKLIVGLRENGYSFLQIAEHLEQYQIKNKAGKVRWTVSMIHKHAKDVDINKDTEEV